MADDMVAHDFLAKKGLDQGSQVTQWPPIGHSFSLFIKKRVLSLSSCDVDMKELPL